jgi:hypothetical protein
MYALTGFLLAVIVVLSLIIFRSCKAGFTPAKPLAGFRSLTPAAANIYNTVFSNILNGKNPYADVYYAANSISRGCNISLDNIRNSSGLQPEKLDQFIELLKSTYPETLPSGFTSNPDFPFSVVQDAISALVRVKHIVQGGSSEPNDIKYACQSFMDNLSPLSMYMYMNPVPQQ